MGKIQSDASSKAEQLQNGSVNIISSPITLGTSDNFYSINLDALKQGGMYTRSGYDGAVAETQRKYQGIVNQPQNSLADSTLKLEFIRGFQRIAGINDGDSSDTTFFYNQDPRNSFWGLGHRRLEGQIGIRTYAGNASGFLGYDQRPAPNGWWLSLNRPDSYTLSRDLADYALTKLENDGPFSNLLEYAPHGFLNSIGYDFDVQWDNEIDATDFNYESKSTRKLSTYWPERLGNDHPLRDVYNLFYSKTGNTYWQTIRDLDGSLLSAPNTSIFNDYLGNSPPDVLRLPDTKLTLLGPVSNRTIVAGDGDKIIAASPVMTPAIHRQMRLSDEGDGDTDIFHADTVLYPSSVGAFGTNKLELGHGDSTVYYDSSFRKISAQKGRQVFLPSFGSNNWSIDWIPGISQYGDGINDSWIDSKIWSSSGPPLISPIPWDDKIINPKDGKDASTPTKSYSESMSEFSASPARGNLENQSNYLYTIFTKRGAGKDKDPDIDQFSRTYLNLRPDADGEDPVLSRNPVNRLGGVKIVAGKFSKDRGAMNYTIPSGDKIFFGADWQFWQHLLPEYGSTLANNPAGTNKQTRAAQHQWHTITFAGGRGNNTFNLGNITDNITNNGLFYPDDASYKISLTHDSYYSPQEILDEGNEFGNIFSTGDENASPYIGTVNLNLQAEPNSYSVMVQTADPGQKGNDFFKNVTPWTGVAGLTQKFLKTPLDAQKDWVENWGTKTEKWVEKKGSINLVDTIGDLYDDGEVASKIWDGTERGFDFTILELEKKSPSKKWYDSAFGKGAKLLLGQVFPWIDLASSAISTVKGLIEFFSSSEAAPPRQEISTTFKEQGLSTGRKAVLINDWNPYAKINLNLPSFSPSDWDALSLKINKPDVVSSGNNTNKGAYLELTYTDSNGGKTSQVDHPLVILENLDKNDHVEKVQKDGGGFAYYTYSFVDPDGNSGELVGGRFNPIRSSSLRLFGQLANPNKIGDVGSITFPADYEYRSENNFDMRNDAENYNAFANSGSGVGSNHYSRYYLGIQPSTKGLPSNWSMSANLSPFTSNVSLEFDSRTQGWYWQPVLKSASLPDGSLDVATMVNPGTQDLDYNASKLWINDPNDGWISFRFSELDQNVTANRYSRLATTFYATSVDKDRDGKSDGQEEIDRRNRLDNQLLFLEGYVDSLLQIDQRLLSDDQKLYSLNQIDSVTKVKDFKYGAGVAEEACLIVFNSVDDNGRPEKRRLILYRAGDELMPAVAVDSDLRRIAPSGFDFNIIVDPSNIAQRPVFDPSVPNPELLIRSFSGVYNPATNITRLFEYVPAPSASVDPDGVGLDEARNLAKNRPLPQAISVGGPVTSHLATIDSAAENDALTGLFNGRAWLAADSYSDTSPARNSDVWHWLEGKNADANFWYVEDPAKYLNPKQGPIDDRYANWDPNNKPRYRNSRQGLAIDGSTGFWSALPARFDSDFDKGLGYIVEYAPFSGLPDLV